MLRAVGESYELLPLFDDGPTFLYAVAGSTDGWRLNRAWRDVRDVLVGLSQGLVNFGIEDCLQFISLMPEYLGLIVFSPFQGLCCHILLSLPDFLLQTVEFFVHSALR